jgi:hypothetical protein
LQGAFRLARRNRSMGVELAPRIPHLAPGPPPASLPSPNPLQSVWAQPYPPLPQAGEGGVREAGEGASVKPKPIDGRGVAVPLRGVNVNARSLSDLKEIGCKSAWSVHVSPFSWSIERLLTCKTVKICPRPAEFSLRFFKSDRLLGFPIERGCLYPIIGSGGFSLGR